MQDLELAKGWEEYRPLPDPDTIGETESAYSTVNRLFSSGRPLFHHRGVHACVWERQRANVCGPSSRLVELCRGLDGRVGIEVHKADAHWQTGEHTACIVGLLRKASPALLSQKIVSGDILHFIDGTPVHDKTEAQVDALLTGAPLTPVQLFLSAEPRRVVAARRNQHGWLGLVYSKIPHGPLIVDRLRGPLASLSPGMIQRGDMIHGIKSIGPGKTRYTDKCDQRNTREAADKEKQQDLFQCVYELASDEVAQMCVCVCVCMYVCNTHTHTHTHTQNHRWPRGSRKAKPTQWCACTCLVNTLAPGTQPGSPPPAPSTCSHWRCRHHVSSSGSMLGWRQARVSCRVRCR